MRILNNIKRRDIISLKSGDRFFKIMKGSGSRAEPSGTPAEIFDHLEFRSLKKTLCFIFFRKPVKILYRSYVTRFVRI